MNGVPTCASKYLETELAREAWGFDGYITGDCGAAADVWTAHKYGGDAEGAAAASIAAGMDVDCGSFEKSNAAGALKSGKLREADLDKAISHLFRLRIRCVVCPGRQPWTPALPVPRALTGVLVWRPGERRLGYFDPPETTPWGMASHTALNMTDHYQQALRAAREGTVLLAHTPGTLPFKAGTTKSLLVAGPNANNSANMQGIDCHGVPPYLINPVMALGKYAAVSYAEGCAMTGNDTSGFAAAASGAKAADGAVLVLGLDPSVEYEVGVCAWRKVRDMAKQTDPLGTPCAPAAAL
eukprot:SAG22_NODE_1148_length_5359_cov_2.946958_7_plen_297_part_00